MLEFVNNQYYNSVIILFYYTLVCLVNNNMFIPMHSLIHAPYHYDVKSWLLYNEEAFSQLLPLYPRHVRDHYNHGFDGLGFNKLESQVSLVFT